MSRTLYTPGNLDVAVPIGLNGNFSKMQYAGSLHSIAMRGECEYVYQRDDWYFSSVTDPASLHIRLMSWLEELISGIGQFQPQS
ncbi:hypothetical protein [Dendronalium sp. ChiSLP03b]|uniref:hypothetical protein n=1 Tax=Dendronalium sp. ChiSLP03b TaxID=3075381 RepID=UPI002AD21FB5|nr:hypothetical protein [Dendronalium sp. ChiSLP03b]MDZ8204499.1 hypothetical protein [Dendronalium sp. ChiSLP03b]